MLNSNMPYQIRKVTGRDVYGAEVLGCVVNERGAIAKLKQMTSHTTVRADSSATRGHADEFTASNMVLLDGNTVARQGDQLLITGLKLRIVSMHPRYDTNGVLDHHETAGEPWV